MEATYAQTEVIIGKWMQARNNRSQVSHIVLWYMVLSLHVQRKQTQQSCN